MPLCEKKPFISQEEAMKRLKEIKSTKERKGGKELKRVYFCESCEAWHLTSMKKKEQVVIEAKQRQKQQYSTVRIEREAEYWMRKKGWTTGIHPR